MYTLSCVVICTKQHVANTDELYASTVMAVMQLTHRPLHIIYTATTPPPQPFYGPFSGTTQVSRCQKRTSGLYDAKGRLIEADTLTIRLAPLNPD